MTIRVGINGFGRIGRNFYRALAAQGLEDRAVLAVDGQEPGPRRLAGPAEQRARADQAFLVGQRQHAAALRRRLAVTVRGPGAEAEREGSQPYVAHCTSTYRRLGHEEWTVVQHQQTPPLSISE